MSLYEILIPTKYGDDNKMVPLWFHKHWDQIVITLCGGMTIIRSTAIGRWVSEGILYEDHVIPVRIACTEEQIKDIAKTTKELYRQKAVMYYKISDEVVIL